MVFGTKREEDTYRELFDVVYSCVVLKKILFVSIVPVVI